MSILEETSTEDVKGNDLPTKIVVNGRCALQPPKHLYVGTGDRQKQYEYWLDSTLRKSFDEKVKTAPGVTANKFITYELCRIAVKMKECESVVFEFRETKHWVRRVDYEKALRKVIGDHLGLLYNVAPYYGVPTKAPVAIDEKQKALPEGVLEALPALPTATIETK